MAECHIKGSFSPFAIDIRLRNMNANQGTNGVSQQSGKWADGVGQILCFCVHSTVPRCVFSTGPDMYIVLSPDVYIALSRICI
ncbi:hypothetical protein FKM82_027215 [Ascaphus truei]